MIQDSPVERGWSQPGYGETNKTINKHTNEITAVPRTGARRHADPGSESERRARGPLTKCRLFGAKGDVEPGGLLPGAKMHVAAGIRLEPHRGMEQNASVVSSGRAASSARRTLFRIVSLPHPSGGVRNRYITMEYHHV